jgi:hypothetical protein
MTKKKGRMLHMRFRKNDPTHNLLAATQHWVKANGGAAIVIGGIGLMKEPFDEFRYKIVVGCTGRPPIKPVAAAKG